MSTPLRPRGVALSRDPRLLFGGHANLETVAEPFVEPMIRMRPLAGMFRAASTEA